MRKSKLVALLIVGASLLFLVASILVEPVRLAWLVRFRYGYSPRISAEVHPFSVEHNLSYR